MSESTSQLTYIYKIVDGSVTIPLDVSSLPDALEVSDLDKNSGFIHLSTVPQVKGTLKHFFGTHERVYLLRIPFEPVESNIKWEDPKAEVCGNRDGEGMFPHLYNGLRLGKNEIDAIRVFTKEKDSSWDKALDDAQDWLIY
ncbi:hypothetical protein Clacol_002375 [Clathrus columnatus]|uniref:Uncharacterized protein n=1 Tax=Clathrus columnatus TaxID=1419009 RepID=A0AAV5A3G7_9AGAM|nr:hypothetical protein Clacol_002375 [Clathrus columnatus]